MAASRFTQADVARALKGALAAGCQVRGFAITPEGAIRVEFASKEAENSSLDPFDNWKARRDAR